MLTCIQPTITFRKLKDAELTCRLSLFGATTVEHGNYTMVCGGMGWDASTDGRSLALFSAAENGFVVSDLPLTKMDESPNPFMIGSSVIVDGNRLIVFGGGATCFSMGTFWDTGVYIAQVPKMNPSSLRITRNEAEVLPNVDFIESRRVVGSTPSQSDTTLPADARAKPSITGTPRKSVASAEEFQQILRDGKPVILESLNLGRCLQDWTPNHMVDRVDGEKQVLH
jgi:tRNA wybutosine-synthesizing protein 4